MPRYEKPSTPEERLAVFETSLRDGGYGDAIERWPAYVNLDVLGFYEDVDTGFLDRDGILAAYAREQPSRRLTLGTPNWTAHRNTGNLVHWAIRLGILVEEVRDGVRGWRLVSRKPVWGLDRSRPGARLVRLQGGTPEEQAERARLDRLNRAREKLRETLAKKACAKATSSIGRTLTALLEHDPEFRIPESWCASGFVPGAFAGAYLSACSPTIREACVTGRFSKEKLQEWMRHLSRAFGYAHYEASERRRAAEDAAQHEDDAALASLADMGGLS